MEITVGRLLGLKKSFAMVRTVLRGSIKLGSSPTIVTLFTGRLLVRTIDNPVETFTGTLQVSI